MTTTNGAEPNGTHEHNGKPPLQTEGNGAEKTPANTGYDARGRFTKGNPGGPGNPWTRRLAQKRQPFIDALSDSEVRELAADLLDRAFDGDLGAAALVLSYVVGKPFAAVNPDDVYLDEITRQLKMNAARFRLRKQKARIKRRGK
jgi:hypothetical protein